MLDIFWTYAFFVPWCLTHSSDIRNTSISQRCSKRSIFKYFKKIIIKIQRLENWPLYKVFLSIFLKAQKYVKYAYVWIELRVCHYYGLTSIFYHATFCSFIFHSIWMYENLYGCSWLHNTLGIFCIHQFNV